MAEQIELRNTVRLIGNYVDNSVPISQTEDDNVIIRAWEPEGFHESKKLSHHEVLLRLDGYDPVRGVKLAGHRGYCLTGYGMLLYEITTTNFVSISMLIETGTWH